MLTRRHSMFKLIGACEQGFLNVLLLKDPQAQYCMQFL